MNWKAFTPLAIAIVLGLLAARVGMSLVNNAPQAILAPTNLVETVVAARDIEAGATLAATDVTIVKTTPEALPTGAFTQPAQVASRVLKVSVTRGQALVPSLLADDGAGYGVGATLPAGYRAITVDINDITGVAGFILPKCKVDVVTTLSIEGKSVAKTVLESVTVLAVGSRTNPTTPTDPQQPQSRTVTLLVKPKDAEKVELAATVGRVRLVLRNGKDETQAESEGITLAELKGHSSEQSDPFADSQLASSPTTRPSGSIFPVAQVKEVPVTKVWPVQIIKGGQLTVQNFDVPTAAKTAEEPVEGEEHVTVSPSELQH